MIGKRSAMPGGVPMRLLLAGLVAVVSSLTMSPAALPAPRPEVVAPPRAGRPAEVREVVVAVRDVRVAKKTLDSVGRVISRMPDSRMLLILLHEGMAMPEALATLSMETEVLFAAPNIGSTATATPSDPLFGQQCGLVVTETDQAWEMWEPVAVTNVAILDTGVSHQHEDLWLKMARTPSGEIDGHNAFNHASGAQSDSNGHGTACAGIAAAQTNNSTTIAGVAGWNGDPAASDTNFTRIMPVRTHNGSKRGTVWSCAGGIRWAARHGAQVVNMSWVLDNEFDAGLGVTIPGSYNAPVVDAVYEAWRKDVVLIASAGNDGSDKGRAPANMRPVFAVGATDCDDALLSDSNYGNWVNVVAPGKNHTTYPHQGHDDFTGTSAAAPIVTGAAALIRSQNPNLNEAYVRHLIETTADEYTGRRIKDGGGRINVRRALAVAGKPTLNLTLSADTTEGGPARHRNRDPRRTRAGLVHAGVALDTGRRGPGPAHPLDPWRIFERLLPDQGALGAGVAEGHHRGSRRRRRCRQNPMGLWNPSQYPGSLPGPGAPSAVAIHRDGARVRRDSANRCRRHPHELSARRASSPAHDLDGSGTSAAHAVVPRRGRGGADGSNDSRGRRQERQGGDDHDSEIAGDRAAMGRPMPPSGGVRVGGGGSSGGADLGRARGRRALVRLRHHAARSERARLADGRLQQDLLGAFEPRRDRQLVQAGQEAAQAELPAQGQAGHPHDPSVLRLRHAHEEMRIGERLAVRLGEGDRLRVVAHLLQEIQNGDAVLERCWSYVNHLVSLPS